MRTVYALFVGIDAYPVSPLTGCVNDVAAAEQWLWGQPGVRPNVLRLRDAQATRSALIDGIDNHLGHSGPGDTALLWFSGHGSERPTDDPFAPTGHSQALVCHDSLTKGGQPLLQDSELGVMLDRIARKGVHVLAVLDCCHAGGATRGKDRSEFRGATARAVEWRPWWQQETSGGHRNSGLPAAGADARAAAPGLAPEHVLVAACRPHEKAYEEVIEGRSRGCFSHSLLDTLDRLGPAATYGAAHALVEERVRARRRGQHPVFRGLARERFLYAEKTDTSPFLLRYTTAGWEVDCGAAHGLRAAGAEFTLLETAASGPRVVTVREVRAETSIVDPVAWQPTHGDMGTVYPVTPSALAFPDAQVTVTGSAGDVRLLEEAVAASPLLTTGVQGPAYTGRGLALFVDADGGWARVSGGAGYPVTRLPLRTATDAGHVADCCAHIARWHQLHDLTNPDSSLSGLVRVSAEPLVGGFRYTSTGDVVCSYTPDCSEPQVRVRIRNQSANRLWCVLLNLTDSYASSTHLFDGDFVGPGCAGTARLGEPVWLRLPPGREVVSGASTRDVLKVIVAENPLNTEPFRLPAWPPELPGRGPVSPVFGKNLHRVLRVMGGQRDVGGPSGRRTALWGTASVEIRTEVP
ncbi:caspase family protein [Streptomyces europaeiscabiei]|uniref:caspase family protein n=1 Tax=Streptomyces europaeiscabiei TaxID=146819 RepID=UPI0029AEB430|nr:caspase family protein [Streptomyces europaeiscabiei]MDX3698100.1 caspase family protein [Streptomyces europaeiscabiei]